MGLTITVNDYDCFDIGYITFGAFRFALASAVHPELEQLYKRWLFGGVPYMGYDKLTDEEFNTMLKIAGDAMIF